MNQKIAQNPRREGDENGGDDPVERKNPSEHPECRQDRIDTGDGGGDEKAQHRPAAGALFLNRRRQRNHSAGTDGQRYAENCRLHHRRHIIAPQMTLHEVPRHQLVQNPGEKETEKYVGRHRRSQFPECYAEGFDKFHGISFGSLVICHWSLGRSKAPRYWCIGYWYIGEPLCGDFSWLHLPLLMVLRSHSLTVSPSHFPLLTSLQKVSDRSHKTCTPRSIRRLLP